MRYLVKSIVFCLLFVCQQALAGSATGTLSVIATINQSCIVGVGTGGTGVASSFINFGVYDPTSAAATSATSTAPGITVTCSPGINYHVALDQGANGSSVTARQMKLTTGAGLLNYALFRDAARTQNWGQTAGTDTNDDTASGLPKFYNVYGQIAPGQSTAPAGIYSDTVGITVSY